MRVRDYEEFDLPAVLALWCTCFPEVPSAAFEKVVNRKRSTQPGPFVVAIHNHLVVGTAVGGMDGINGWIYMVAVHPDVRRLGLGSRLVRAVETRLRKLGAVKVGLQVLSGHEELIVFYKSLGYAVEPRVSMAKRLGPSGPDDAANGSA